MFLSRVYFHSVARYDTGHVTGDRIACTTRHVAINVSKYACTLGLSSCRTAFPPFISSCGRCHVSVFSNQFPLTGMLMRRVYTKKIVTRDGAVSNVFYVLTTNFKAGNGTPSVLRMYIYVLLET